MVVVTRAAPDLTMQSILLSYFNYNVSKTQSNQISVAGYHAKRPKPLDFLVAHHQLVHHFDDDEDAADCQRTCYKQPCLLFSCVSFIQLVN